MEESRECLIELVGFLPNAKRIKVVIKAYCTVKSHCVLRSGKDCG